GNRRAVRRCLECVGSLRGSQHLLAPSASELRLHHSFCSRDRVRSQLAEKSLVSLCDHRTAVLPHSDSLPDGQPPCHSRERQFGMVTTACRNGRRVPVGMEVLKASRFSRFVTTPRTSLTRTRLWFSPLP